MAHGQITHIEIPADDVDRARRFYREIFGTETSEIDGMPGYFLFTFGSIDAAGGAIGKRGVDIANNLRVYFEVTEIDPVLAKVPDLGGKVVTPRSEIPGQGYFAVIEDSEGTELGLFEVGSSQG
jgi:predicted enzyme related to lactoylglutathione lyase